MNERTTPDEIREYSLKDDDFLYVALVPASDSSLYSEEGRVARGRQLFFARWQKVRRQVCPAYQARKDRVDNLLDLAGLVLGVLADNPLMQGIPVLPMSAIIVKLGLVELCADSSDAGTR